MASTHHPHQATAEPLRLRDGRRLWLRAVQPQDAASLQAFFAALSPAARRLRLHGAVRGLSTDAARRLAQAGGDTSAGFVLSTDDGTIVAEASWSVVRAGVAEFGIAVADAWQGQGLGARLMAVLEQRARSAGLRRLVGEVLADNGRMQALLQRRGYTALGSRDAGVVRLACEFGDTPASRGAAPAWAGWFAALRWMLSPMPA
ncbi:MAG: GNAT family N-acetyltransferase [Rubrivivax sp.]|nr:GNAT family N-acetyltransferase [Rubrivivax sp.]